MSFILDALKKSEQERRQGEVPGLRDESPTPKSRKGSIWFVLMAAALLTNGIVLGWWLSTRQGPAEAPGIPLENMATAASTPRPMNEGRLSQEPLPAPFPEPIALPGKTGPAIPSAESNPLSPERGQIAAPLEKPATSLPGAEVAAEPVYPGPEPADSKRETSRIASGSKAVEQIEREIGNSGQRPVSQAVPMSAEGSAKAAAAPASFPLLSDLSAAVRTRLPELNLQLHFFTAEPERRMIRLNNVNLREGQESGGITIIGIDPDGVRLACKGTRFFLPSGG